MQHATVLSAFRGATDKYGLPQKVLDLLNEIDYCLLCVFEARINKCLCGFMESWNHHNISTEHNHALYQLFVVGTSERCPRSIMNLRQVSPPSHIRVADAVDVPWSTFTLCQSLELLQEQFIYSISPSIDLGISIFKNCVRLVGSHIQVCPLCACTWADHCMKHFYV